MSTDHKSIVSILNQQHAFAVGAVNTAESMWRISSSPTRRADLEAAQKRRSSLAKQLAAAVHDARQILRSRGV
jgi:hypothetical protein